jgi:flagellar basal body P-ring formation protein FlgA
MQASKFIYATSLFLALTAHAGEWQSLDEVSRTVERFVRDKTTGSASEIIVTPPDARLHLGKCDSMETWLPSGNRLWGRASVGVRCRTPATWSIYVPVTVRISGNALVAARQIERGHVLDADDIQQQVRELTQYPSGVLTNPSQAIGKTSAAQIQSGDVLRPDLLRAALAIRQGQQVILIAQGAGFKVSSEGTAMGNATSGQVVAVKTRSGQTIKGIAKGEGVVEVYF